MISSQANPYPASSQGFGQRESFAKNDKSVLFFKKNYVTFDPPDRKQSIFFDECNRDVISIYASNNSKTRVLFQTTDHIEKLEFALPVEKIILSIKLNRNRTIVAYHVEKSIVEFLNINYSKNEPNQYSLDCRRYMQACRSRNSKLLGFIWTSQAEIVLISDISIEFYSVDPKKHRVKHIKSFPSSTNWFVYQPNVINCDNQYSILMISTGSIGNSIQPFLFANGQISKLDKFIVDGDWNEGNNLELFEQSITIAYIYGNVRLLVLQHESLNVKSKGAQVLIYTVFENTGETVKTHTLDLNLNGRFALNVFDNLVIAHDQPSKTSLIFDIMVSSTEKYDCPNHYVNIGTSQSIRSPDEQDYGMKLDMYSADWVFFQPNFIIDVKMGVVSTLHVDLAQMHNLITEKNLLLDFLSLRSDSADIILSLCANIVINSVRMNQLRSDIQQQASSLADVTSCFEIVHKLLIPYRLIEPQPDFKFSAYREVINQQDFFNEVLRQLSIEPVSCLPFIISIYQEFIYVMREADKDIEPAIVEQFVLYLLKTKRFFQLVQMMRSNILPISKNVGCLLISQRAVWKPALSLGKEILRRLDCITDVLETIN